jgi:hypothetical protein
MSRISVGFTYADICNFFKPLRYIMWRRISGFVQYDIVDRIAVLKFWGSIFRG